MTTFLVLARTAPSDNPDGDMSIYAASFDTSDEAFRAVEADLPRGWKAVQVIGPASEGLQHIMQLEVGSVERLGGVG